jgi:hypothetical protein
MYSPRQGAMAALKVWDLDFVNSRIRLTINEQRKGAAPQDGAPAVAELSQAPFS